MGLAARWIACRTASFRCMSSLLSDTCRSLRQRDWHHPPPLRIPVPAGTVIKRRRGGALLGDLTNPGDSLVVAEGGRGGTGVVRPSHLDNVQRSRRQQAALANPDVEEYIVDDVNWAKDAQGLPGAEVTLQLLLRVVADIGIVGLPNAGKSSLLAAMTRAKPGVQPYPFTTLTPNLGVLSSSAQEAELQSAVLADLPGLIKGAHQGRGLGHHFLRHLRRTRALLHVLDAAAEDPAADYWAVREELRLYNPSYCTRPHVVALNKMDLPDAEELQQEVTQEVQAMARRLQEDNEDFTLTFELPSAIVATSAVSGAGVPRLQSALQDMLIEHAADLGPAQTPSEHIVW